MILFLRCYFFQSFSSEGQEFWLKLQLMATRGSLWSDIVVFAVVAKMQFTTESRALKNTVDSCPL